MTEILEAKAEENPEIVKKGPYDQIIVFGDSITQQACSQDKGFAFIPALQNGRLLSVQSKISGVAFGDGVAACCHLKGATGVFA